MVPEGKKECRAQRRPKSCRSGEGHWEQEVTARASGIGHPNVNWGIHWRVLWNPENGRAATRSDFHHLRIKYGLNTDYAKIIAKFTDLQRMLLEGVASAGSTSVKREESLRPTCRFHVPVRATAVGPCLSAASSGTFIWLALLLLSLNDLAMLSRFRERWTLSARQTLLLGTF